MPDRPYYGAYDERYRLAHDAGLRWMGDEPSHIVMTTLRRYGISRKDPILEIGCGEGRDAEPLLKNGYDLLAADVSPEAIRYCRRLMPEHAARFRTLDCLTDRLEGRFDFIYAIAVLHMLVPDEDRLAFYRFIREHLTERGVSLVAAMGDGKTQRRSDIRDAYSLRERESPQGTLMLPSTSCRTVDWDCFRREIRESGLTVAEEGLCSCDPQFDSLMYAVIRR